LNGTQILPCSVVGCGNEKMLTDLFEAVLADCWQVALYSFEGA
jgi:hypothetical protein